jgi:hypothetical protein
MKGYLPLLLAVISFFLCADAHTLRDPAAY